MPYGTIHVGQMFVQYFEPAQQRHPLPVLLVHGGGGQSVHYMGLGGTSGWAHHFVQAGYKVYLVDRPGHGRSPYHPDALGEIGPRRHLRPADARHRDVGAHAEQAVAGHAPATSATRWSISSWRPPTPRRATPSWRRICGGATAPSSSIASGPA